MHRTLIVLALAAVAIVALTRRADAHSMHFLGPHPVAAKYGGGFCVIEAPHIHIYPPDHPNLYQRVGDQVVFTADPTPFGYEGEKHPFYGHHPVITVNGEPVICYIDGPHYHGFAAPDTHDYQTKQGVAFYVGAFPPSYEKVRQARARAVNAEYRPYVALRPTVEVTPPEHWQGEVWRAPGIVVGAPGVVVGGPEVEVSAPGVAVIAPGPPGIVVGGPSVGVVVGAPGVVVEDREHGFHHRHGEHGEHFEERGHHDNGRHEGWSKHEGGEHHGHR
jgi:hypothetical protein